MYWIKNSRNLREYSWINTYFQKNILNKSALLWVENPEYKKNDHQKCPNGRCFEWNNYRLSKSLSFKPSMRVTPS